jgi:hypothetical protein
MDKKRTDRREVQNQQDGKNTLIRKPLYEILSHYLDTLKINPDASLYSTALSYVDKISLRELEVQPAFIEAAKIIVCAAREIAYTFSHSELSDILTMAVKEIRTNRRLAERNIQTFDQVVFNIYKDLVENYQGFDDSLKRSYPETLVNVISIINSGKDASGVEIGSYNAEVYYHARKVQRNGSDSLFLDLSTDIPAKQERRPITGQKVSENDNLIGSLSKITGRTKASLHEALKSLSEYDLQSIKDLCSNYNKLQKYCDLSWNEREFREEAERELGRKLLDSQVQHAILSVRRSKTYIENVLDDKFVPDRSHGINHVKHNLEYGYQLIGIIQSKRKRKKS